MLWPMISHTDTLLGPIKAIVSEELPEYYTAEFDLSFGNLCEGQEDNFKLSIDLFYKEGKQSTNESIDWSYRIAERIHDEYGSGLLISTRMPEATGTLNKKLRG